MATKQEKKEANESTVVVVGGHGGMSSRYREVAQRFGCSLRHFEQRIPPGVRHGAGKIALVVVMVGMVSHALRDQIKELVTDDTKVVYLRTASVSALRAAVEQNAS
ncbi:hypothetical protein SAMN02745121_04220 [Nannocystis exedens]|uniref:DUF2325 domain-containing protein n=1 Tax=Nannocystis exedens TaxID=54 RepID=A0A1I2AE79_9BACT|nr:DUF2325 domain-containing protein [Nannocystis exedens]PCC69795.1 hypothetical protein NAEX_02821 [Nannocystis exedens]SFE42324.1 hypothetical protein SAMN02745121_04220 [Nannocystis exedens]